MGQTYLSQPALPAFQTSINTAADTAILQQRQILSIPAYDIEPKGSNPKRFRYFSQENFPRRFRLGGSDSGLFNDYQVVRQSRVKQGAYVSLDPCTCSEPCPTPGVPGFGDVGSWTRANVGANAVVLLYLALLALIPTGSILALYAVPSVWGRLGFIVGESAIVIAVLAAWRGLNGGLGDGDVLAYAVG